VRSCFKLIHRADTVSRPAAARAYPQKIANNRCAWRHNVIFVVLWPLHADRDGVVAKVGDDAVLAHRSGLRGWCGLPLIADAEGYDRMHAALNVQEQRLASVQLGKLCQRRSPASVSWFQFDGAPKRLSGFSSGIEFMRDPVVRAAPRTARSSPSSARRHRVDQPRLR
jgi:hypothetical protein